MAVRRAFGRRVPFAIAVSVLVLGGLFGAGTAGVAIQSGGLTPGVPLIPVTLGTNARPTVFAPGELNWTLVVPSRSPSPRAGAAMAYDPVDGYILLFGGCASNVPDYNSHLCVGLGDTWKFQNGTWTNLTPTISGASPSPRTDAGMVWDSADGYLLMFGGYTGTITYHDTWAFQGGAWYPITTAQSPSPRYAPGMAYDARDGYTVLFGGAWTNSSSPSPPTNSYQDTWTYRAGVWTNITSVGAPAPRFSMGMDYDANLQQVVMFGGWSAAEPLSFGDTWTFAGGVWSEVSSPNPPPARNYLSMVYDSGLGGSVLTQGHVVSQTYPDLWQFRSNESWTSLPVYVVPAGRWGAGLAFDDATETLVLFGGYSPSGALFGDTWILVTAPSHASAAFPLLEVVLGVVGAGAVALAVLIVRRDRARLKPPA
jgi:hypothetical protein